MADTPARDGLTGTSVVEAAAEAFAEATARTGLWRSDRRLAGRHVRVEAAGNVFGPIFDRAIADDADRGTATLAPGTLAPAPDLVLRAWDGATTGAPIRSASWLGTMLGPAGTIEALSRPHHAVSFDVQASLLGAIDLAAGSAFHYTPDAARLPPWEVTHPARMIWGAWARSAGLQLCHAAAVADRGRGVLLVGPSGSGKSTTALACLRDGLECAGDDYILVDPVTTSAHALYRTASLEVDHAGRHATLLPSIERVAEMGPQRTKAIAVVDGTSGRPISGGFPLVAVAAPRVSGLATTSFRRIAAGAALRALAPSTMSQLGQLDLEAFRALAAICRRLPCYGLDLGLEIDSLPAMVRAIAADAQDLMG